MRTKQTRREQKCMVCASWSSYDLCVRCTAILRETELQYQWRSARALWQQWQERKAA